MVPWISFGFIYQQQYTMEQSLLRDHRFHIVLFMCFWELVLAGIGEYSGYVLYQFNGSAVCNIMI